MPCLRILHVSLRAGKHTILIVEPRPHSERDYKLSEGAVQLQLQDAGIKDEERDLAGATCLAATAPRHLLGKPLSRCLKEIQTKKNINSRETASRSCKGRRGWCC